MRTSIVYDHRTIPYDLVVNPALSGKIRIHVHPHGLVEVEAPPEKSPKDVVIALYKRARWISQRLDEAAAMRKHALPREYISGETHFYLGRRYQLKIMESSQSTSVVLLKGGNIQISLPHVDRAAIKRRLNAWYRARAQEYFQKRLADASANAAWVKVEPPVKLVAMRKQWGSCSPTGSINLNPWLIRAPRDCIDYVIAHELCHLREHNHSKKFYALLDRQYPEWRQVKHRLDGMAELLLAE
jgi:predicted metal-dependent hydrolase